MPLPLLAKVPLAMLKRVVGLGLERPATLGEIDGMVRFYATAGVADYAGGLAASSRHGRSRLAYAGVGADRSFGV